LLAGCDSFDSNQFRDIVKQICAGITARELESNSLAELTHGERVYREYGFTGARGEAEMGYPVVFKYGLPVLYAYNEVNDTVLKKTLLAIAAHNNDTNILYRGGREALTTFKHLASIAFENFSPENYDKLIAWCREHRISPGGSADLLVMSIFVHSVTKSAFDIGKLPALVDNSELYKPLV
ncbi:MAG: triphosphoribosyl-dephospho-CoA synthase, partial [Bacteroidales bacterium]|nr:triphosphoribosyl-dephospho-CoA synthase [Bacteroidales bacterium]